MMANENELSPDLPLTAAIERMANSRENRRIVATITYEAQAYVELRSHRCGALKPQLL
jgi:hypothetical protein